MKLEEKDAKRGGKTMERALGDRKREKSGAGDGAR
jgi:hypothetical protein